MLVKFCEWMIDWCIQYRNYDSTKRDIYIFGADLLLSTLITSISVLIVGGLMGCLHETVLYLAVTSPLRMFGGGWHAPKHYLCTLLQIATFILVFVISTAIPIEISVDISVILLIITLVIIWFRAPSEHPNNPLDEDAKRSMRRTCMIIHLLISTLSMALCAVGQIGLGTFISISAISSGISFLVPNREKGGETNEEANHSNVS